MRETRISNLKSQIRIATIVFVALHCGITTAADLVVVPFAVPVAVPVAVVQRPTLFYSVSQYAPPSKGEPAVTTAVEAEPLRAQVGAILEKRCAECHRADRPQGDVTLFDAAGSLLEKLPRQRVVEATDSNAVGPTAMPPAGRERLSPAEWNALREWARMPKSFVY